MTGRILAAVAFVVVSMTAGCATPCSSCGWEFRMGRPATFNSPGLVQQTTGPLMVSPLGTTLPPIISGATVGPMTAEVRGSTMPRTAALAPSEAASCTMEDLCVLLRRIDAKLWARQAERLPLPKGSEQEQ